jgi:hypothetical protein
VHKLRRSDDWRASAFLLERRFPAEFGRCAERELPVAESGEKRINVAFILPSGEQISWAQARAIAQLPPANQTGDQSHAESTLLNGDHATEPNGEQPLS